MRKKAFWVGPLGIIWLLIALTSASAAEQQENSNPFILMKTSDGDITIKLFARKSPLTVQNFLNYVDEGHYDGTIFHRVISNFMIQGGGFDTDLIEKPTRQPIVNESRNRLHNTRGTIAMARTSDPHSATAQFFINQRSNLQLDWTLGQEGYVVFGEVIDGLNVVDIIALSETSSALAQAQSGQALFQDVPVKPVEILSISRITP